MATRKSKIVGIFPTDINEESTKRIILACRKILDLCAKEQLTISDMQSLPEVLCTEIRLAITEQISGEIFRYEK